MPTEKEPRDRDMAYICGDALLTRMVEMDLEVSALAARAQVAEQTVRNYLKSNEDKPWPAKRQSFHRICEVLQTPPEDLQLPMAVVTSPHEEQGVMADKRFVGDPAHVRSIEGTWIAESVDLEIPGLVTYRAPIPWNAQLVIRQCGNRFEVSGDDKDGDSVLACGTLLECGNWLRFNYWIDNATLREYGVGLVEFKGDGRTLEGLFVGRDAGHSSIGVVVAKLTLRRQSLDRPTQ